MRQTTHLKRSNPAYVSLLLVQAMAVACLAASRIDAQTATDPYPQNSIAFFNAGVCPGGWEPYGDGNGRFVIPVNVSSGVGDRVLSPLSSGQDPTHTHEFSSFIEVKRVRYAGSSGGGNTNLGSAGKKEFSGITKETGSNVPYIQLLICIKNATPGAGTIPSGVTSFFRDLSCPAGWSNITSTLGRFLLALPLDGSVQKTSGGLPLAPDENRVHRHKFSGSVETTSHGIAGASGCKALLPCAKGYAKNGTYSYNKETDSGDSRKTEPGAANLPYIQLLQCKKL